MATIQSDANRTSVRLIEEASAAFGTVPANPRFKTQRIKSHGLQFKPVTKVSQELAADRNVTDLVRVGIDCQGPINMEVAYGALDDQVRQGMMNDWVRTPVRDNDGTADSVITAVDGSGAYTVLAAASPTTDASSGTPVAGMLVSITGFAESNNNGLKPLTAATGTLFTTSGASTVQAVPPAAARIKVVGFQGASADLTATATTIGSTTIDFTTLGLAAGQWIYIGGTAVNTFFAGFAQGWARISAVVAHTLTFDIVPTGMTTDTGTGKTIQLFFGDYIRNGIVPQSCDLEVEYSDLAVPEYDVYVGNRGGFEVSANEQDILQFISSWMGINATNSTTRTAGATTKAANTNGIMNTSSQIGVMRVNGALVSLGPNFVKAFSAKLDNTLRRQNAIGSIGSLGIGLGRAVVTGKLDMYYGSNAVRTAILAGTAMSFQTVMYDPTNTAAYHVDIPNLKWTDGTPSVPGIDSDRILSAPFQGLKHATLGYAIQWSRYDYLPI